MTDEEIVAAYIKIRDKKATLISRHKAELTPYHQHMQKLEEAMGARLRERGADSTKTDSGTAFFKTVSDRAKVIDRDAFIAYVRENEAWDLITNHVSSDAVTNIVELTKSPPPGVDLGEQTIVVQFRRS